MNIVKRKRSHFKCQLPRLVIMAMMLLSAISVIAQPSKPVDVKPNNSVKSLASTLMVSDSVVSRLGDSVSTVIWQSTKATLYQMDPLTRPTDNDKTIGGIKVEKKLSVLSKKDVSLVQFLLSDANSFTDEPLVQMTIFAPFYCIELNYKNQTVGLLFSLTSEEVGVVYNGVLVKVHRYSHPYLFTRYMYQLTKDEFLKTLVK